MEKIEVTFKATMDDLVQATFLGWPTKKRFGRRFWAWMIGSVALLTAATFLDTRMNQSAWIHILPAMIIGIFILLLELSSNRPTRRWMELLAKANPRLTAETIFSMDDSGVGHGSAGYSARFAWDQVTELKTSPDMFVFLTKVGTQVFVPTRALSSDQQAQIKEQAESKGLKR